MVWCLTGLWHGAALQFVVWGLMFAVLLVIEKHWLLKKLENAKIWNHIYVLFVVMISFVIFNAADMKEAVQYIAGMLGVGNVPFMTAECAYYLKSYGVLLIGAMAGSTPLVCMLVKKFGDSKAGTLLMPFLRSMVLVLIFVTGTAYLIDSSFNPFLYFRF